VPQGRPPVNGLPDIIAIIKYLIYNCWNIRSPGISKLGKRWNVSIEGIKKFTEKIAGDAGLKARFAELIISHDLGDGITLAEKIAEFGKSAFCDISVDDLLAASGKKRSRELDDEDLRKVAGGEADGRNAFGDAVEALYYVAFGNGSNSGLDHWRSLSMRLR